MPDVTIGTKNQIVIPLQVRKQIPAWRAGKVITVSAINKETITITVSDRSWLERGFGIMKEAWKDIDPIAELKKMREEWDDKW